MLITACVAARADQPLLHECLDSVRAAADEVLVAWLDVPVAGPSTGGTTPLPALPAGCEHAWDRDAAIDRTIASAAGDWVLWLEGHERLASEAAAVRAAIHTARTDALLVHVRRLGGVPAPGHRPVDPRHRLTHGARTSTLRRSIRLFRRRPEYRFGGRVELSVAASLRRHGVEPRQSDLEVLQHPPLLRDVVGLEERRLARARELTARQPHDAAVWMDLGACFLRAGRAAEARECLAEAGRLQAGPTTSRRLAHALLHEPRLDDALSCLDGALRVGAPVEDEETREEDLHELRGEVLRELGRGDEAAGAHLRVLALAPDRPIARAALTELIANGSTDGDAAAHAGWLTERYPGLAISWIAAALVHLGAGRVMGAIDALRVALDIDPTSAPARRNLGIAYSRLGARAVAHETMRGVHDPRLGPTDPSSRTGGHRPPLDVAALPRLGPDGVVSYLPFLDGGAARVADDLIRALHGRPQALVVLAGGDYTGMGLAGELECLGVPLVVNATAQIESALERLQAGVVIEHALMPHDSAPLVDAPPVRIWIDHGGARFGAGGHDWYVCLSEAQRRAHASLPEPRVEVIPNGIDVARFARAQPDWSLWRSSGPETVRIAMLTRLDDSKCARRLLHYLRPLGESAVEIAIAGRGARRWEIQQDLPASAVGAKIRFVGPIPSAAVPGFLAAADLGLHLTETHEEALSIGLLEMLAAGLPIVSQPRGCLTTLVGDGVNGALAEGEADVADRLLALVRSPGERARMGAASRRRAWSYDLSIFAARWQGLVDRARDEYVRRRDYARRRPRAAPNATTGSIALADHLRGPAPTAPPVFLIAANGQPGESRLIEALESTGAAGQIAFDVAWWRQRLRGRSWRHDSLDAWLETCWTLRASPRGVYGSRLAYDDIEYLAGTHGTSDWPARWLARARGAQWIRLRGCEQDDPRWHRFFSACRLDTIEVSCIDLERDTRTTILRLLAALHLPAPAPDWGEAVTP